MRSPHSGNAEYGHPALAGMQAVPPADTCRTATAAQRDSYRGLWHVSELLSAGESEDGRVLRLSSQVATTGAGNHEEKGLGMGSGPTVNRASCFPNQQFYILHPLSLHLRSGLQAHVMAFQYACIYQRDIRRFTVLGQVRRGMDYPRCPGGGRCLGFQILFL